MSKREFGGVQTLPHKRKAQASKVPSSSTSSQDVRTPRKADLPQPPEDPSDEHSGLDGPDAEAEVEWEEESPSVNRLYTTPNAKGDGSDDEGSDDELFNGNGDWKSPLEIRVQVVPYSATKGFHTEAQQNHCAL